MYLLQYVDYRPSSIYPDIPTMEKKTYEKSLELFIDRFLEGYVGQVAFYQFGKIRNPGVSDLDLLIIVEDNVWKHSIDKARFIISSEGLFRFLFTHDPVIVGSSFLPFLPFMHTLENCYHIYGDWDPVNSKFSNLLDQNSDLIRHAIWNSFMRIAALELDHKNIGLRRALILMHNLLTSALNGNKYLHDPIDISLTTEEIRKKILSSRIEDSQILTISYINKILSVLDKVDTKISSQMAASSQLHLPRLPIALNNVLVVNQNSDFLHAKREVKILKHDYIKVCPVPDYIIFIMMCIACRYQHIKTLPCVFQKFSHSKMEANFEVGQYFQILVKCSEILSARGITYFFPLPFAYNVDDSSLYERARLRIREFRASLAYTI